MAFGTFEVHAGSFALGSAHQVLRGYLLMKVRGRFSREKIPLSEISDLEVASEEALNRLGGALGWGAAGAILLGPVGELAGLIRGGRGQRVTFVCQLRDGRKFLATASSAVFSQLRTSFSITEFGRPKETPTADIFDRQKWAALVRYDQDIASAESEIRPFGQKYVEEFASAYLALNDKDYLPKITAGILQRAGLERNTTNSGTASEAVESNSGETSAGTKGRCRVCGKAINAGAISCPYCGTKAPHIGTRHVAASAGRSVLSIAAWLYAVFFGFGGAALLASNGVEGYALIASALAALPLSSSLIRGQFNVTVPGWARAVAAFCFLLIAAMATPSTKDTPARSEAPVSPSSAVEASKARTEKEPSSDVARVLNKCVIKEAKTGIYTSSDGGKSAMRMLIACKPEWYAYADACEKSGKTDAECTEQSAILAQAVLKLAGR